MSTSIHDQELDQHFAQVEKELYSLQHSYTINPESNLDTVYYDFENPNTFLLTWTWHGKPHRS
jgi:hypothetical protein